jgi:hypothetical protein
MESLFANARNGLLQQNLPRGDIARDHMSVEDLVVKRTEGRLDHLRLNASTLHPDMTKPGNGGMANVLSLRPEEQEAAMRQVYDRDGSDDA